MIAWVDIETTGLVDVIETGAILEIAVVLTNDDLDRLDSMERVLHFDGRVDHKVADVVMEMHSSSGLWSACAESRHTYYSVQDEMLDWLERSCMLAPSTVIVGGANVGAFDRVWLQRWMPALNNFFHYRCLDISTIKNMVRLWGNVGNPPEGHGQHRALPDTLDSIEAMRFYRDNLFPKEPK